MVNVFLRADALLVLDPAIDTHCFFANTILRKILARLAITFDGCLAQDLGLVRLIRVELLWRVEQSFGIRLSETVLEAVEPPRDFLIAGLKKQMRR
jgi:acyl carrier protein